MTKCYYCKQTGQTVAHVKECAGITAKPQTLEDVLGADVNPDPKAELDKWQAAEQAKIAQYSADLAKVEIGVIVEDKPAAPAVPAHKAAKLAMFGTTGKVAPAVIPFNPAGVAQTAQVVAVAQSIATGTAAAQAPVIDFKALVEENKAAKAATGKNGQDLETGMYQVKHENGAVTIFKVKFNKSGTYKMAEKLVISQKEFFNKETGTWDVKPSGKFYYAQGMMMKLTSDNKMSEEDAKAFHDATKAKYGVDYGFCCVCGKLLTVKKSIADGIGPVCKGKL